MTPVRKNQTRPAMDTWRMPARCPVTWTALRRIKRDHARFDGGRGNRDSCARLKAWSSVPSSIGPRSVVEGEGTAVIEDTLQQGGRRAATHGFEWRQGYAYRGRSCDGIVGGPADVDPERATHGVDRAFAESLDLVDEVNAARSGGKVGNDVGVSVSSAPMTRGPRD